MRIMYEACMFTAKQCNTCTASCPTSGVLHGNTYMGFGSTEAAAYEQRQYAQALCVLPCCVCASRGSLDALRGARGAVKGHRPS